MMAHPDLEKHSSEFRKDVVELAPGIFTAVGFAASNVHVLVGNDGLVIIDTTESTRAAANILAEIRKISALPVKTIIYTHSHRDHISGATVFADGGDPEIIASHLFRSDLIDVDETRPSPDRALQHRTVRQFGIGLSFPDERVNLGCGPGDRPLGGLGAGFLPVTHMISEKRAPIERCGFELELVHAPGETPDHLIVWLPKQKILFCGDNYYKSFPNLYAIRGTPYRDFDHWANTLDELLQFQAEILSPGHSRPVIGSESVAEVLADYRDAIRHIVSECVAGMNAGASWDELAHSVKLPSALAVKPHLREFYGKVSWAVRAFCVGRLGWFDGNPTNLNRLSPRDEARGIIDLAGGPRAVLQTATKAFDDGQPQWAMELADRLVLANELAGDAVALKIRCLQRLADDEINATARNYYLSVASDLSAE